MVYSMVQKAKSENLQSISTKGEKQGWRCQIIFKSSSKWTFDVIRRLTKGTEQMEDIMTISLTSFFVQRTWYKEMFQEVTKG